MLIETFKFLFKRDLLKLKQEIESYNDQSKLWYVEKGISNSAGNLCLHLIGNLNHFIGATLGSTGYVRNRELEFSQKNVPADELVKSISDTVAVVESTLNKLSDDILNEDFPLLYHDERVSTMLMLTHLLTHFGYHLGQINYFRRLYDKN
ncbi:MAG: DUF1572 family protein [Ignavibacteriaceae bacterium]